VQRHGAAAPLPRPHIEAAVVDRLAAMRGPGEDYSDVILRVVELEASGS